MALAAAGASSPLAPCPSNVQGDGGSLDELRSPTGQPLDCCTAAREFSMSVVQVLAHSFQHEHAEGEHVPDDMKTLALVQDGLGLVVQVLVEAALGHAVVHQEELGVGRRCCSPDERGREAGRGAWARTESTSDWGLGHSCALCADAPNDRPPPVHLGSRVGVDLMRQSCLWKRDIATTISRFNRNSLLSR